MSEIQLRPLVIVLICVGVVLTLTVISVVHSTRVQSKPIELWSHATQIVATNLVDQIALYEDGSTCRTVFTAWTDSVIRAYDLLDRNPMTSLTLSDHGDIYENGAMGTRLGFTRTRLNQESVYKFGDGVTAQTMWFANATTVAMIGQKTSVEQGDCVLRFLNLRSGFVQSIDLHEMIGLIDCNVLYVSPWDGSIAVTDEYNKTVHLLDVQLDKDRGQWQVDSTDPVDPSRYKITAVAISRADRVAYCLDSAYEPVVLKWRGASKRWERVGKNDYSLDGGYVGNIAVDADGNIACIRYVNEGRSGDGIFLDRFTPRGERKTSEITRKTDVGGAAVAFSLKGDSAYLLLGGYNSNDNDTVYRVNFIGSMSSQSVPHHSTLIPGKGAYLLCRYGKLGKSRPKRDDVLYEID